MSKHQQPAHAGRKDRESTSVIALGLTVLGGTLGYFIAPVAFYYQPHGYHLLGMPLGALLGWLVGYVIHKLQGKRSA
jgi:hypothetical protein